MRSTWLFVDGCLILVSRCLMPFSGSAYRTYASRILLSGHPVARRESELDPIVGENRVDFLGDGRDPNFEDADAEVLPVFLTSCRGENAGPNDGDSGRARLQRSAPQRYRYGNSRPMALVLLRGLPPSTPNGRSEGLMHAQAAALIEGFAAAGRHRPLQPMTPIDLRHASPPRAARRLPNNPSRSRSHYFRSTNISMSRSAISSSAASQSSSSSGAWQRASR